MKKNNLNIIIIEPSAVVLRGLSEILKEHTQITVTGTYPDILHYTNLPQQSQTADIAIVNPTLLSYEKRGTIRKLFPDSRIVALLYNYTSRETLAQFDDTIEIYDTEAKIISRLENVIEQIQPSAPSEQSELSDREKEILVAVAKGLTNKEIADRHNISAHTVISHRKNISRKTGIKSVSGFVVYALLNNLIEETDIQ